MREVQRDEPDAERETREQVAVGLVQHGEVAHHAQPDLQAAGEPGREHHPQGPLQALGTLVDHRVEGLLDLVLDGGVAVADLAASFVGHRSDRSPGAL